VDGASARPGIVGGTALAVRAQSGVALAMEITRWRPPRTLSENAGWRISLADLEVLLTGVPELSPDLRAVIIAAVFQRVRDKRP
jgi:hypothetical protein